MATKPLRTEHEHEDTPTEPAPTGTPPGPEPIVGTGGEVWGNAHTTPSEEIINYPEDLDGYPISPPADNEAPAEPPPATVTVTAVDPATGTVGTAITVTGTGLGTTIVVRLETFDCDTLEIVSDTEIRAVTPAGPHKGVTPILVGLSGGALITGPDFTVT